MFICTKSITFENNISAVKFIPVETQFFALDTNRVTQTAFNFCLYSWAVYLYTTKL